MGEKSYIPVDVHLEFEPRVSADQEPGRRFLHIEFIERPYAEPDYITIQHKNLTPREMAKGYACLLHALARKHGIPAGGMVSAVTEEFAKIQEEAAAGSSLNFSVTDGEAF